MSTRHRSTLRHAAEQVGAAVSGNAYRPSAVPSDALSYPSPEFTEFSRRILRWFTPVFQLKYIFPGGRKQTGVLVGSILTMAVVSWPLGVHSKENHMTRVRWMLTWPLVVCVLLAAGCAPFSRRPGPPTLESAAIIAPRTDFAAGKKPWAIALADLNRDGTLDVVVVNQTAKGGSVLLGNGDGTFGPEYRLRHRSRSCRPRARRSQRRRHTRPRGGEHREHGLHPPWKRRRDLRPEDRPRDRDTPRAVALRRPQWRRPHRLLWPIGGRTACPSSSTPPRPSPSDIWERIGCMPPASMGRECGPVFHAESKAGLASGHRRRPPLAYAP